MSGGVDSCASALMLHEQGYSVVGISMQVWDYRKHGGNAARATCCAPSDFDDARSIADSCGFPYYVFDFEDSFYKSVISPFVRSYLSGRTPNPCLDCNRKVKFHELRIRARTLGIQYVATGHFAQVRKKATGELGLFTSIDQAKDQSYFLYSLTQADLQTTLFPVGGMVKSDVRQYLRSRGFQVASKAESQDICFVGSTVSEFIEREVGEQPGGKIVSSDGAVLGEHGGVHKFTVGQRRGLGVSSSNPLYVINIDPTERLVTVGEKDDLERIEFEVSDINWVSGIIPSAPFQAFVKLRYRHSGVLCEISPSSCGSRARLRFLTNWSAVSPGQAAVFYSESTNVPGTVEVLGGGIIEPSIAQSAETCTVRVGVDRE